MGVQKVQDCERRLDERNGSCERRTNYVGGDWELQATTDETEEAPVAVINYVEYRSGNFYGWW